MGGRKLYHTPAIHVVTQLSPGVGRRKWRSTTQLGPMEEMLVHVAKFLNKLRNILTFERYIVSESLDMQ
ncbi:hypothetical protein FHX06_007187 [Rhizobium sp. BK512]|nr:hypothetical protein [Rhizobium sp. BK512]